MNDKKYLRNVILAAVLLIIIGVLLFITLKKKGHELTDTGVVLNSSEDKSEQTYLSASSPSFNEDDRIIGSDKAPLKIFVYENNTSLYSAELAATLDKIYLDNKDEIAIITRPFLNSREESGREAALLIECASEQGKWLEMRSLIYQEVHAGRTDFNDYSQLVAALDLNEKEMATCLTSEEKYAKIEKLSTEAEQYGVSGTPTIFISEEMILGARPYDDYIDSNGDQIQGLKSLINKRLANSL